MNLADANRDSSVNPLWRQIKTDGGGLDSPANQIPGAFIVYSILGGSSGFSSCQNDGADDGTVSPYSGDINATALALAWPEYGHGLTARDSYRNALPIFGLSSYGDYYVRLGASCDAFVATVMRYSGADPGFVCCGISGHGATWSYVTNSSRYVEVTNSASTLQPGDIRLSGSHIEMYVVVNGVGKIASASHGERTAEIGNFYDNSATFNRHQPRRLQRARLRGHGILAVLHARPRISERSPALPPRPVQAHAARGPRRNRARPLYGRGRRHAHRMAGTP